MKPAIVALIGLSLAACHRPAHPVGPASGSLGGLVRDAATGEGVEGSRIVLRRPGTIAPSQSVTDGDGAYMIADLPPGRYEVTAYADETRLGEREVEVIAGRVSGLDFVVGAVDDAATVDLNAPSAAPLWRYRRRGADPALGEILGTVTDLHHGDRLAGAVVSLILDGEDNAEVLVTNDSGRFAATGLRPGTYTVSALYELARVGQIEVRRTNVQIGGGETVVVPLWLSTDGF